MTIRHLQIFKTVCDETGVTAAAEKLNMTQPAVSLAIKELEVFYNAKLFDRANRRLYLTEPGRRLLDYADAILNQFDSATNEIRDGRGFTSCRMGVNVTAGETIFPSIYQRIMKNIPEISLDIQINNTEDIMDKLDSNIVDMCVIDRVEKPGNYRTIHFMDEEMFAVCANNFPCDDSIALANLADKKILLREKGSACRSCVDHAFEQKRISLNYMVESSSTISLIELARLGAGVVFLPKSITEKYTLSGMLRKITLTDCCIKRNYYLVYRRNKYMTHIMKRVIETVINTDLEIESGNLW